MFYYDDDVLLWYESGTVVTCVSFGWLATKELSGFMKCEDSKLFYMVHMRTNLMEPHLKLRHFSARKALEIDLFKILFDANI